MGDFMSGEGDVVDVLACSVELVIVASNVERRESRIEGRFNGMETGSEQTLSRLSREIINYEMRRFTFNVDVIRSKPR